MAVDQAAPQHQEKSTTVDAQATVFIVDDDPAVRGSMSWLLESVDLPVEVCASAQEFLDTYNPAIPGCLVLDIRLPGMGGMELQKELAKRNIHIPIIIVTGHAEVPMAVRAMKAGAVDFIEKPFSDQVLLDCIRTALQRDFESRGDDIRREEIAARIRTLTPREFEVKEKVVEGNSNKMIAAQLGVSRKTVEAHRAGVMKKMKAQSVADLVRMVTEYRSL
ncbi:Response regulator protein TmoT [Symmachiella dynata]|uniref:Response regulator protein TmoT n=1 Tax=Symmachiella dynata TaxID=2527995 RepID=A0A517ZS46_9PLAN|nr:response regulator transcription factor [Symmachiella dynata]QDT49603.1 Response regulator protein TmoT [Symmachiella dynata]QDU45307.1 Response regulator protein TmoT [Symmachiella dynata]